MCGTIPTSTTQERHMPRFNIQQCWENASASTTVYRIPAETRGEAINMRQECNKFRRKVAHDIYGEYHQQHYYYDLTVTVEELDHRWYLAFWKKRTIELPPPAIESDDAELQQ